MQENEEKNVANKIHSFDLKKVISHWPSLAILEINFLSGIRMIMAIRSANERNNTFIIVKKDGNVYNFGSKTDEYGIKICSKLDLCGKNIKTFIQNYTDGIYALTDKGEVYCWGRFEYYTLQGSSFITYDKPTLVTSLSNKNIIYIVCGKCHAFALTVDGKIYAWESIYDLGSSVNRTPIQVKSELENKKIVSIASGSSYSIMVTDSGEVYCWGSIFGERQQCSHNHSNWNSTYNRTNNYDCSMNRIIFSAAIVKVACGSNHALALTDQGNLYVWGKNDYGQLGTGNMTNISDPVLLNTSKMGKLSDIAAVGTTHISVAVNEDGCFYVWGLYDNCRILIPHVIHYTNMYDVFASENIMYKPLILSADEYPTKKDVMKWLKNSFDDPSTSDFKVHVQERDIYVHKAILNIRSSHFRAMFRYDWKENSENVLKDNMFSYNVYKGYLKYLYTGVIDIPPEEVLDLLKLADMYGEMNLKTDCIPIIQREVTISNVALFYSKAIESNEKRLQEFCFSFMWKYCAQVLDIAAVSTADISVAVNEDGCFYVWGLYDNCRILIPHAIHYTNMYDVFTSENIIYKPLILSADEYPNKEDIMRCLKDVFDDPSTSDFKIRVKEQDIHVHKAILKIRSSYFKAMFQYNWKENNENVLKQDMFSYNVYKAYLKYLYTSVIDIPPEEALDLLKLADMYGEMNLKTDCIPIIQREVTIKSNVTLFYSKAIESNEKRLEKFCSSFILQKINEYFAEVVLMNNLKKLRENDRIMFMKKASEANAFEKCSS